jgi:glycosyltransferase involved in cell wall biosynthesis
MHMVKNPDLSVIIPVFNEGGKVRGVLDVLQHVEILREIIVIDDGSTDMSSSELKSAAEADPRIIILTHPVNQGKGQAIFSGWQATYAQNLLLLDGDLYGIEPQHVLDLVKPVLENQADMTIGQFQGGEWKSDFSHWATPWLSGQRCLRAHLLGLISWSAAQGYGIETALTAAARHHHWRCVRVPLVGMWHQPGESRRGFLLGIKTRSKMYAQVVSAWYKARGFHRMRSKIRVR